MEENTLLDRYLGSIERAGKTSTLKTYRYTLLPYARWLKSKKKMDLENATVIEAEEYLAILDKGTARTVLSAIRGLYRYNLQSLSLDSPHISRETQRYNQICGIRLRAPQRYQYKAISLDPDELQGFLQRCRERGIDQLLYEGLVLCFYFGARPIELEGYLFDAEINWAHRWMKIKTAKTGEIRYIPWHKDISAPLKYWYKNLTGCSYPGQWLTKTIQNNIPDLARVQTKSGEIVPVTARVGRKTVESQLRLERVPDVVIRAILGHTHQTISDEYTDFTKMREAIDDVMNNQHYMILGAVLEDA